MLHPQPSCNVSPTLKMSQLKIPHSIPPRLPLLAASRRSIQRGNVTKRDPVCHEKWPLHPANGSAGGHSYLPVLHRGLYLLQR